MRWRTCGRSANRTTCKLALCPVVGRVRLPSHYQLDRPLFVEQQLLEPGSRNINVNRARPGRDPPGEADGGTFGSVPSRSSGSLHHVPAMIATAPGRPPPASTAVGRRIRHR